MRLRWRWPLWSLMAGIAVAAVLLVTGKSFWPGWVAQYRDWQKNRPVHAQLARTIPLSHPAGGPLTALISAVKQATRCPELPAGIPIYVDPQGLQDVGATWTSPVTIDVGKDPLGQSFRAALQQLKLDFMVRNGSILIGNPAELLGEVSAEEDAEDSPKQ